MKRAKHRKSWLLGALWLWCSVGLVGCGGCRQVATPSATSNPAPAPREAKAAKTPTKAPAQNPKKATSPAATASDPAEDFATASGFSPRWVVPHWSKTTAPALVKALKAGLCTQAEAHAEKLGLQGTSRKAQAWKIRLGRCFADQNQGAKARALWQKARKKEKWLRDYLLFWEGKSWQAEQRMAEASKLYQQLKKGSRFYKAARLQAAELLLTQGKAKAALKSLQQSGLLEDTMRAWWLAAKAHRALRTPKHRKLAAKYLRRVYVRAPGSGEAAEIEAQIRAGQLRLPLSWAERVERAGGMNRIFVYRKAIRILGTAPIPRKVSRKVRCRFYYHRGFAWFRRRKYRRAVPSLLRARPLCKGQAYFGVRSVFRLGQAYRRRGMISRAIPYFKALAKEYPTHYLADDAIFTVAELTERTGRLRSAKAIYESLARRFPRGDMVLVAQWRIAYQAYRKRQWPEAIKKLKRLARRYGRSRYAPAALYFAARSWQKRPSQGAQALSHRAKASRLYRRLVERYPLHYYSFLALSRLQKLHKARWTVPTGSKRVQKVVHKGRSLLLPWGPLPSNPPTLQKILDGFSGKSAHFLKAAAYRKGIELLRMGLPAEATREWMRLLSCKHFPKAKTRKRGRRRRCGLRGDPGAELLALHFHLARQYHLADRTYRRRGTMAGRVPFHPKTFKSWFLAYPRPYATSVQTATAADRVFPSLVYGLMREESTFNPQIQSWAKAYGLMQMLFSTARATARTRPNPLPGHGRLRVDDLLNPKINIRLGVRHLRVLLRQFRYQLPMAIGSYNAGARWVKRWLRRNPSLPLDEWVEAISIKQTRHYVKRVMQSYAIYHFLYGKDGQSPGSIPPIQPWWRPGTLLRR